MSRLIKKASPAQDQFSFRLLLSKPICFMCEHTWMENILVWNIRTLQMVGDSLTKPLFHYLSQLPIYWHNHR